jgi:hypothetical protein
VSYVGTLRVHIPFQHRFCFHLGVEKMANMLAILAKHKFGGDVNLFNEALVIKVS